MTRPRYNNGYPDDWDQDDDPVFNPFTKYDPSDDDSEDSHDDFDDLMDEWPGDEDYDEDEDYDQYDDDFYHNLDQDLYSDYPPGAYEIEFQEEDITIDGKLYEFITNFDPNYSRISVYIKSCEKFGYSFHISDEARNAGGHLVPNLKAFYMHRPSSALALTEWWAEVDKYRDLTQNNFTNEKAKS